MSKITIPILLPKMGESVSEATIIEWFKKPGDKIERDELFVLIGTDKVESELPCEYEGVLKEILVPEKGETEVGAPICMLEVDENDVQHIKLEEAKNQANSSKSEESSESIKSNSYKGSKSFLSPVVRMIATEAGLELNELEKIKGSGENGRIQKKDILKYLNPEKKQAVATGFSSQKMKLQLAEGDTLNELSRMQKLLADHLQQSFMEIPHVTTFAEVDVTNIVEHRENIKDSFFKQNDTKITYTHYFQYAIIQALKDYPLLNTWMNVDEWIHKKDINLGFAASLANGELIVPNVKAAQDYDFISWVKAVNDKAAQAKSGKLANDDVQNTTFTVSNTGMFGSLAGTPIISKPQVGVLALGQILSAAGVIEKDGVEQLAVRKKMMLSISYDHRVINGAYASQFLTQVKENLKDFENWF
ncbi:2-oxo acid dehydrogenase subunit E2 [Weeksellaceae bacterium KMM 9713]|uniref:Dihydrolipoamide acetyltransferase component of pyruvate dehydrogenase complex n=1 Tax=Profundicola chukchiensis TaxID=2961959 RepID=A0A9X4N2R8_9FLAO|nr:dihydrolipoamide acetyltransferase family protein [Profundicola chukchiensis]MDG4945834.1 2-oxo acid dehydrogenase subunit E2 [Profundicola chukchiensis]MDG4951482.1 2-oxo acid dehydrogenase subunit E2 [Profundicola chukchiensis]